MSKTDATAAARQAAHRQRRQEAGLTELRGAWVPAELVEQARKVVADLAEQHKAPTDCDPCRQAFEAWATDRWQYPQAVECSGGSYALPLIAVQWTAWQQAWLTVELRHKGCSW